MLGAVQTGCFVMATVGAFYLLTGRELPYGRTVVRLGVTIGAIATILQLEQEKPPNVQARNNPGTDRGPRQFLTL